MDERRVVQIRTLEELGGFARALSVFAFLDGTGMSMGKSRALACGV